MLIMENTTENKARFFALYFNKRCAILPNDIYIYTVTPTFLYKDVPDAFLSLRSISSLTDEEILKVRGLLHIPDTFELMLRKKGDFLVYKPNGEYYPTYGSKELIIYDYLRSIGILIPWMDLSVEQIIEYGWAKEDTSC